MKKTMNKTRITAAALSAITIFSVAGMSLSTASAASLNSTKPAVIEIINKNETKPAGQKSSSEIAKGIATKVFKIVLEKVKKTGMPASLVCDGLSLLFDLVGYLDGKTETNPDVEKIINAIDNVSKKMDQYHNEEMNKLILINSNINTQKFREEIVSIVLDYLHANKKINEHSAYIKKSGNKVIDAKTYKAFKKIINDAECQTTKLQKNLLHMAQYALGKTRVTAGKNGFEAYTQYLIDKINDLNSDHNFIKAADFTKAAQYINNEMDSIAASCVLDYITILTIKKMEYKVEEYENSKLPPSERQDFTGSYIKFINDVTETTQSILNSYEKAKEKSSKALQAQVTIDGVTKGFSNFADAWATAINSGKDFTIKACQDLTADAARGFNTPQLNDKFGFNDTKGFIIPEGRKITVDMGGHTINCTALGGIKLFDVQKGAVFTLKNGQVNGAAEVINYVSRDEVATGINAENVKINNCSGTAILLDGSHPNDNMTIKNCEINGSKKGAVRWTWRVKYMIINNRANCNGGIYLGALTVSDHVLRNVTITGNSANHGGGIYCNAGAFMAADTYLCGKVIIRDNRGDNAYLVNDIE